MNRAAIATFVLVVTAAAGGGGFWWWRKKKMRDSMLAILTATMPNAAAADVADYAGPFADAASAYGISSAAQLSRFIGQCSEESNELWHLRDHYGTPRGEEYADGSAYEGRADLGNTEDGDGVKYKGRGPIQCTGKNNYQTATDHLGHDFVSTPEDMDDPAWGTLYAAAYFTGLNPHQVDCRPLADAAAAGDATADTAITKAINGGTNGLAQRIAYSETAAAALATEGVA